LEVCDGECPRRDLATREPRRRHSEFRPCGRAPRDFRGFASPGLEHPAKFTAENGHMPQWNIDLGFPRLRPHARSAARVAALLAALLAATFGAGSAALAANDLDNKGTEFLMAFLPNLGAPTVELHLTADSPTQVTVEYPANSPTSIQVVDVTPGNITVVSVPVSASNIAPNAESPGWIAETPRNNLVRATANLEFVAYMVNRSSATSDAAVALPVDVLNTEYIVVDYDALGGISPEFAVFAGSGVTNVLITPSIDLPGHPAGTAFPVELGPREGYLVSGPAGASLTGTIITADRPIGLTNGDRCTNIPVGFGACDHIFEVAQPVQSWGTESFVANLPLRERGSIYRVVASEDATTVNLDGGFLATLDRGDFVEVPGDFVALAGSHIFTASAPIFVVQFMTGFGFEGNNTGDPAMGNMIPAEQYLSAYTFSTVGGNQFDSHYLTVIADDLDRDTITLDGSAIGAAAFTSIAGSGFSSAVIVLAEGTHTTSSVRGHGITVEGFGSADSYIYPGGALFVPINTTDDNPPLCDGGFDGDVFFGSAADDRPTEDTNGNGELDEGEDLNGNGIIDVDTGIFALFLDEGVSNLTLTADFTAGDPNVSFQVAQDVNTAPGFGDVIARDGAANECAIPVSIGVVDETPPECDLFFVPGDFSFSGTASDDGTGIASIDFNGNQQNLSLSHDFDPPASPLPFEVTVDDTNAPALGTLTVTDGVGLTCTLVIDLPLTHPSVDQTGWGEDVALQEIGEGLYAYVASGEAGVHIYDVSDSAEPPELVNTEVPLPGDCAERTDGFPDFYADGLKIVQAADLPFDSDVFDTDVAIFATGACGIIAADISDPMVLETLFVFDTPSWAEAVDVFIDPVEEAVFVYVASFWGGLRIFGQTDPEGNPEAFGELGTWGVNDDAFGPAIDLRVERRDGMIVAHVLTDRGLWTVDVSDPTDPVAIPGGSVAFDTAADESGEGMTIVGDRAFVALWQGGILVLDISDPANPVEVEAIPTDLAIYSVTTNLGGTRLYATEGMFGLRTFRIKPDRLVERIPQIDVADGAWAWSAAERNRFLYVSYGRLTNPLTGGLQVFEFAPEIACGLGFELVFALPPLLWLRSRRSRTRRA
jgi:hypothetical protein